MLLSQIKLYKFIEYCQVIKYLDAELNVIVDAKESKRDILYSKNQAKRAFEFCKFFEIEVAGLTDAKVIYNDFESQIEKIKPFDIDINSLVYGQFHDSKMIIQGLSEKSRFEVLPYVIAIYNNGGELYDENCTDEESPKFKMALNEDLEFSFGWMKGFENMNKIINDKFSVFSQSEDSQGGHLSEHMQKWGWLNFLKAVVKTKVFDIAGMNSIDSARMAKLNDVLIWASEDHDYNIALNNDMEQRMNNNR